MKGRIQIKVNGTIPGYPPGSIVEVETDDRGIPLNAMWRRRLKDSALDECCEVIEQEAPAEELEDLEEPADDADGSET